MLIQGRKAVSAAGTPRPVGPEKLSSITINNGGTGYAVDEPLTFTGGGGSGMAGVVSAVDGSGVITAVSITDYGTGYTSTPAVGVTTAGGSGANLAAVMVGEDILVEALEIHARKNTTTANAGNIFQGFSPTAGQNYRVIPPGESWSLTLPHGQMNLGKIYIDAANNGDAVTWTAYRT